MVERERGLPGGSTSPVPARAAVLGHPISHSLSPVLHTAAYAQLGLGGWSYEAVDCTEAGFPSWFADLGPQWRGLSLTMPLKQVVIPLLDEVSPLALAVGAVNTVTWDDDHRGIGNNTDVHGIVEALRSVGVEKVESACILGAGATACSAVAALSQLGCTEIVLQVRSRDRAAQALAVADRFGVPVLLGGLDQVRPALDAGVLINTLPGAAATAWSESLPSFRGTSPPGVLLDVNYHPWPTVAAAAWTAAGGIVVGGFEMLLHQAAVQVTLMTGLEAPVEAMRAAGLRALS
jgi:shikimate dehydrogenase